MTPMKEQALTDEYIEMGASPLKHRDLFVAIQFGFCVMFTAAFPLAPFFALLNNLFEIRGDAYKFTRVYRRPVPFMANGIGIWVPILNFLSSCAVLVNVSLIKTIF